MTIQEELAKEEYNQKWLEAERELSLKAYELAVWLNGYLTEQFVCNPEMLPIDECLGETLTIIRRFHSQGAAIKVDRELPKTNVSGGINWQDGYRHAQEQIKQAGYVAVESLIKEGK